MHESVNRGQRHSRFGKDMVPARERLIGRDRHAATLIALGDQLEQHAAELITGKATDWADMRYRVGVIKGLREALSIAKDANAKIIGVEKER